jgi:NADH-quinone oxidoreductase subunit M
VEAGYLTLFRVMVVLGAVGTVLNAGYFLWLIQRVLMGKAPERWASERFEDVSALEWGSWAPLLIMILALGLLPFLVFGITDPAVSAMMAALGG